MWFVSVKRHVDLSLEVQYSFLVAKFLIILLQGFLKFLFGALAELENAGSGTFFTCLYCNSLAEACARDNRC